MNTHTNIYDLLERARQKGMEITGVFEDKKYLYSIDVSTDVYSSDDFPLLYRFVERCIRDAQITRAQAISEFLGLEPTLVERTLMKLESAGLVASGNEGYQVVQLPNQVEQIRRIKIHKHFYVDLDYNPVEIDPQVHKLTPPERQVPSSFDLERFKLLHPEYKNTEFCNPSGPSLRVHQTYLLLKALDDALNDQRFVEYDQCTGEFKQSERTAKTFRVEGWEDPVTEEAILSILHYRVSGKSELDVSKMEIDGKGNATIYLYTTEENYFLFESPSLSNAGHILFCKPAEGEIDVAVSLAVRDLANRPCSEEEVNEVRQKWARRLGVSLKELTIDALLLKATLKAQGLEARKRSRLVALIKLLRQMIDGQK